MLNAKAAVEQTRILMSLRAAERSKLDTVRRYWKGRQRLPAVIDPSASRAVRVMALASRVNVMPIVVNSLVQSMYVDGFRAGDEAGDDRVWQVWQANRMDARQMGIHRATTAFGTGYAVVTPGEPVPVIRGYSPRSLTAMYGESDEWPIWALVDDGNGSWRLLDDEHVYFLAGKHWSQLEFLEAREHGAGVCPVVRYMDEDDLDSRDEPTDASGGQSHLTVGQIAPLIPIQDQIDLATFGLQIAQHAGAFRQRYAIGWVAETEAEQLKASASRLWTIDENPEDVTVGEFGQTDLGGYIESREASFRHASALSQTPVHELTATLIQMSAEALAAAEAGKDRKVAERQALAGESHEQLLQLVGRYQNVEVPDDAQVIWRDTSARAFAATVDGLGKLVQMLGVPPQELWQRIPGVTKQDADRWAESAAAGDSFANLAAMLEEQAGGLADDAAQTKSKADSMNALIRSGVEPESAAAEVGLAGVKFTDRIPNTLRVPEREARGLEERRG